jgi:hypothetical protein
MTWPSDFRLLRDARAVALRRGGATLVLATRRVRKLGRANPIRYAFSRQGPVSWWRMSGCGALGSGGDLRAGARARRISLLRSGPPAPRFLASGPLHPQERVSRAPPAGACQLGRLPIPKCPTLAETRGRATGRAAPGHKRGFGLAVTPGRGRRACAACQSRATFRGHVTGRKGPCTASLLGGSEAPQPRREGCWRRLPNCGGRRFSP